MWGRFTEPFLQNMQCFNKKIRKLKITNTFTNEKWTNSHKRGNNSGGVVRAVT